MSLLIRQLFIAVNCYRPRCSYYLWHYYVCPITCFHSFDCVGIPRCYDHSPLNLLKGTEEGTDDEEYSTVVISPTESIIAGLVSTTAAKASPVQLQHEAV